MHTYYMHCGHPLHPFPSHGVIELELRVPTGRSHGPCNMQDIQDANYSLAFFGLDLVQQFQLVTHLVKGPDVSINRYYSCGMQYSW